MVRGFGSIKFIDDNIVKISENDVIFLEMIFFIVYIL